MPWLPRQPFAPDTAIGAQQNHFLPEADIVDELTVRADYESYAFCLNPQSHRCERDQVEILDRILDKAFEFSGADRGVILLLNEEGEP